MKTIAVLMSELRQRNIRVWAEGETLRYKASQEALTPEVLAELKARKQDILTFCKQANLTAALPRRTIQFVPRDRELPLSFAQQRLWFLHQWEGPSPTYNVASALRLTGKLDSALLDHSLNEIIRRHEILRTSFSSRDGVARQDIAPALTLTMPVVDLCTVPETDRLTQARQLANEHVAYAFDLTRLPLIRVTLLKLAEHDHILLIVMHHIISDGWSLEVFSRELSTIYDAFSRGVSSPLPELTVQYADFACSQREWLQGDALTTQLSYWQQHLAGMPAVLELPADHPHRRQQTFRGGQFNQVFEAEFSRHIQTFAQDTGISLFATFLSTLTILFFRYTGRNDVPVGYTAANRNLSELESLIGFFVNTLILRGPISGEMSGRDVLKRTQATLLETFANQEVPFEKLVEVLQPERDPSRSPLVQVVVSMLNAQQMLLQLPDLTIAPFEFDPITAKHDLDLEIYVHANDINILWIYNADLFEAPRIQRMAGHFRQVLQAILDHPDQSVATLPILTEAECQQILEDWNATQQDYPQDVCLHTLIDDQGQRTPDAVAVICEEASLTYRELIGRANQLAHYLQRVGVGPETLVGICAERSLAMIIGLLGIMKAGGIYVPFDPEYPAERLAFMLDDSQVEVMLTQLSLRDRLPACEGVTTIALDADWSIIAREPTDAPICRAMADNGIYMIYTSGSTGQPKGALNIHRALCSRLLWMQDAYQLTPADRALQKTPFSFDVSGWEFFWPLLTGACLVFAKPGGHTDSIYLARLIAEQRITIVHFVPAMLQLFLETDDLDRCQQLRHVICSGEALSTDIQRRFFERFPSTRLHNLYGPTEAAIDVTAWECTPISTLTTVPIGKPIANTRLYILDAAYQPVPIGIPGGLYIGGVNLARGYHRRPDLTADKFIPNPFGVGGDRLYKTGDVARYLPDGNIEFLGRSDHQVKLRGFRIELGDIESALRTHPGVQESVVLLREDHPGDKRLIAYIMPHALMAAETAQLAQADLRAHLQRKLPEYMVPAAFIMLDALPLLPNGKVNRRALPAPDQVEREREQVYVAPRTPIEELLAGIWAEVLRQSPIGIQDNFFYSGGHSLLATQVVSRIQTTLSAQITVRQLFESPTIAELGQVIEASQRDQPLPPIQPVPPGSERILSFAQERLWFLDQLEGGSLTYSIPFAVRLTGPLNLAALEQSLRTIVLRHETLRTYFPVAQGKPRIVVTDPPISLFTLLDLHGLSSQEQSVELQRMIDADVQRPFRLAQELPWRITIVRLDAETHVLAANIHHIACDEWTVGVFWREFSLFYQAYQQGKPSPLPELPIQYSDFAYWQRQWLQGEVLECQLNFWRNCMAGAPDVLDLPTDHPRPPVQYFRGRAEKFVIPLELTEQLHTLSRRRGVSLFMTLQTAFMVLLFRYSGQTDLVIGSPLAGRTRTEIEPLIGLFVNFLPLRTTIDGNPEFIEVLAQNRTHILNAYAHQDVPFEKLVEALQPTRNPGHTPVFQVVFNFHNAPMTPISFPDVHLEFLEVSITTSPYDLLLSLEETAQGLQGWGVYNSDLFEPTTISTMIRHYRMILETILINPRQRVLDIPLDTLTPDRPDVPPELIINADEKQFSFA